jgi:hypothetical protein
MQLARLVVAMWTVTMYVGQGLKDQFKVCLVTHAFVKFCLVNERGLRRGLKRS